MVPARGSESEHSRGGGTAIPQPLTALAEQAGSLETAGNWDAAGQVLADLFRLALQARDVAMAVEAARGEARVRWNQGRYEEAEELADLSVTIAERHHLDHAVARALNVLGLIRHAEDDRERARSLLERALEKAREVRDDELIGIVCQNLGVIANIAGDFVGARSLYLESIGSAVRSGNPATVAMAYNNLGLVCADLREWMEAELYLGRGIEIAEQIDALTLLTKLYVNRAESLVQLREFSQARATLQRGEQLAEEIGDYGMLSSVGRFRGAIARLEKDWHSANQHLSRALLIAARSDSKLQRAETLEELARLRWEEAKPDEALSLGREARTLYLALGAGRDVERVQRLLAEWETAELVARWGPEA
jgi:tetratricopeptide (TPR) repeat protein